MKNIKFIEITHELYAYRCETADDPKSEYNDKITSMCNAAERFSNELRAKYAKFTFAAQIGYTTRSDSDDDAFTYLYLSVPEAEKDEARRRLINATSGSERGWCVEMNAVVSGSKDVDYSEHPKRLRPGQLAFANVENMYDVIVKGVERYGYDYGEYRNCCRELCKGYRKDYLINKSGLSTKLLGAVGFGYGFDAKKIRSSRLKNDGFIEKITVYIKSDEAARANLMRIARSKPECITIRATIKPAFGGYEYITLPLANADKSDFIKAYYSARDKVKKAEEAQTK